MDEPVPDVDYEGHHHEQHRQPEGDHHQDGAPLTDGRLHVDAHAHPADKFVGVASRRMMLEVLISFDASPTMGRKS